MQQNKLAIFTVGSLILGMIIGGLYVNTFGVNLPLRDKAVKSSAALIQDVDFAAEIEQGEDAGVSSPCSYTTKSGGVRHGTTVRWQGIGWVCQSDSGWSANYTTP